MVVPSTRLKPIVGCVRQDEQVPLPAKQQSERMSFAMAKHSGPQEKSSKTEKTKD